MGDIADSLINGEFDYITGEYIGSGVGYPRTWNGKKRTWISKSGPLTEAERTIKHIRKELAILIKEKQKNKEPNPVNNARKEINLKYGKDWREKNLINKTQ